MPAFLTMALMCLCAPEPAKAEDADRFRPYLHWRLGEFAPQWDVFDLRGLSLGANLDRHWGVELSLDAWQLNLDVPPSTVHWGEQQVITLLPQVRYRLPLWRDRLVPYAIAGAGGAWIQFNDVTTVGAAHQIDADGITWAMTAGGGIDFFLLDNIAFNVEAKYVWSDPIGITLDGNRRDWDASSFLATIGLRIYFSENHPRPLFAGADADAFRPVRLHFSYYGGLTHLTDGGWASGAELAPKPNALGGGLDLAYVLAIGADFGEHLGLQLDIAYTEFSLNLNDVRAGEYSVYSISPVLRWRFPSASGRWAPYVLGGAGLSYGEFNDPTPSGKALDVRAKGLYPGVTLGGGVDYFLTRNVALSFETRWRHAWGHELSTPKGRGNLSDVMFTLGLRTYLLEFGNKARQDR